MKLEPGQPAPDFNLLDQDGRQVSLNSYRGRKVLVYFYPKDDTPGCTKEACQFNDSLPGFEEAGVDILGISADDAQSHRAFRAKYGLRFRLLSDPGHEVAKAYAAWGERMLYGKPVTGILRSTFLIDAEGGIERVWYDVQADGHAGKVLEGLGASR
ncbi:MAG: thioredoxin-dependent thiol peroxidase [Candidatus Dormibacteraeota bacterium]|nr:thioredoxin-dependent thiol peroxidase [Candidatus Dormibacteraeota bacterium]